MRALPSARSVTAVAAAALSVRQRTSFIERRASYALLGAVVGDAAAQTCHWNYDREAFHVALREAGRYDDPEFFQLNKFYSLPLGSQSCYGDQLLVVARHLNEWKLHGDTGPMNEGGLVALVNRFESAFDSASPYGPWPLPKNHGPDMPVDGPWRHGSLKGFLTNLESGKRSYPGCGSDDSQADALARTIPIVCAYAGDPKLLEHVEKAVRVTQNSHAAVAYARLMARILEAFVIGKLGTKYVCAKEAIRAAICAEKREESVVALKKEETEARVEACKMLSLVLEILESSPSSFLESVSVLGKHPLMKPHLTSTVALVS